MTDFASLDRTCSEFRHRQAVDRRSFLRVGMLGAGGLSLSELLRREAQGATAPGTRENSVIILWMRGGPSHIDM